MLSIGSIVLNVDDVPRAVAFWRAALGYVPRGEGDDGWDTLVPADGASGPQLALQRSDRTPQEHPQVHLDLYPGDGSDQAAEVERLLALGATRVAWGDYPPGADFVVLADPAGNRFCVIDTSG